MELTMSGEVSQFYGPHNAYPSRANKKLLKQFLDLNRPLLTRLRKDKTLLTAEEKKEMRKHEKRRVPR